MKALYQVLAVLIQAAQTCYDRGNKDWEERHMARITALVNEHMPSGAGWNSNTRFDFDASTEEKLVFTGSFHHMNEHGYYIGWTDHTIIVKASLMYGFTLTIKGEDRNGIKDHLYELFDNSLRVNVD